jgi:very-short-patch-repair endonuclease
MKIPKLSIGEESLAVHLSAHKIPFQREYRFCPDRKWRFDFMLGVPNQKFAIECEGGTWGKSRHTSGKGYIADIEKYNTAALMGFKVLRFTTEQIRTGQAIQAILGAITTHCKPAAAEGIPPAYTARSTHSHANVEELQS